MIVMRTLLPRATRFAAGAAITLSSGVGLVAATSPAAHASVREAPAAVTRSIKYPGATAIEYGVKYSQIKWEGSIKFPGVKYPGVKYQGSVKYPSATAIEYRVKAPHITFPHITF